MLFTESTCWALCRVVYLPYRLLLPDRLSVMKADHRNAKGLRGGSPGTLFF